MKNKLIWIIVLTLIIRILLASSHNIIEIDGVHYTKLAENLISGNGYKDIEGVTNIIFPPLYPLLIGLVSFLIKNLELTGRLVSILFGVLLIIPIFYICKKFYNERVAYVAALFAAVYPVFGYISGIVYSESTYLFFLGLGILAGWIAINERKFYLYLITGLIFGLSYLTRPEGFVYLGVIILFSLFKFKDKKTWFNILSLIIGFLIIASPYLLFLHKETNMWTLGGQSNPVFLEQGVIWVESTNASEYEKAYEAINFGATEEKGQGFFGYILSNPKRFLIRYTTNVYRELTYSIPLLFPIFLFLLVGLGLFRTPWTKLRLKKEIYLICFLIIPLLVYPISHVSPRMFILSIFILIIWLAKGCVELENWNEKLRNAAIIFIVLLCLAGNIAVGMNFIRIADTKFTNEATEPVEYKEAGLWLKENTEPNPVIMARKVRITFYAEGLHVRLPSTDYNGIIKNACEEEVNYIVLDKRSIEKLRPNLIFLLNEKNAPNNLRFVHKIGDNAVLIYKPLC